MIIQPHYPPLPQAPAAFCRAGGRGRGRRRMGLGATLLMIGGLCVADTMAQPSMQTILTNGPASNRLNIVMLSEAYTSSALGQFLVDTTNAMTALMSYQPYAEYRSYFNAFAIKVPSNQTNSDHP